MATDRASYTAEERPDSYWVKEKDPEKLAALCWVRIENYFERIRASYYFGTLLRNWAYYHNLYFEPGYNFNWSAVKQLGKDGGILGVSVNHLRNFIQHILTLSTQQRPDFETRAMSGEDVAIKQAELGDNVLDHYLREDHLEDYYTKALEHALVLNVGYVHHPWDWNLGQEVAAEKTPMGGGGGGSNPGITRDGIQIFRQGDFSFSNPTVFDVVYDLGIRDWRRRQWAMVRTFENRWDLVESVKDAKLRDEILSIEYGEDQKEENLYRFGVLTAYGFSSTYTDQIPVWHLYHVDSAGVPGGVQFRFAGDGVPLGKPAPLMYEEGRALPLFRCTPYEIVLSTLGYSVANDLQGAQELYNQETSTIATNHKATGFQVIAVPHGWEVEEDYLSDGVVILRGDETAQMPPAGVQLTASQKEFYQFRGELVKDMEYISGVNSVARGQPEANYKSGEALKVMDAKAVQFSGPAQKQYANLISESGTFLLRNLRDIAAEQEERMISLVGESNRSHLKGFQPEDLKGVDRVTVDVGNPLSKTVSGRLAISEHMMQLGFVKTPEELIKVMASGRLEPILKADQAQLDRMHEENESLSNGQMPVINLWTDYHMLDIREHGVIINSQESRSDPERHKVVLAHIMQHIQALLYMSVQQVQMAMGFQVPFPPTLPGMPGEEAPGGGGGAPGGQPGAAAPTNGASQPAAQPGEGAPPGGPQPQGAQRNMPGVG